MHRKKINSVLLAGLAVAVLLSSQTSSATLIRASALGGVNYAMPSIGGFEPNTTIRNEFEGGTGFGLAAGVAGELDFTSLGAPVGLELGYFFFKEKYKYNQKVTLQSNGTTLSTAEIEQGVNSWILPILVRYWFMDMFSPGVGFYFAGNSGKAELSGTAAGVSVNREVDLNSEAKADTGLALSFAAAVPIAPMFAFRTDARYYYGLEENNVPNGGGTKHRNAQLLVGLQWSM